ncbi:MAG: HYR domain-containing protein [Flavobacteriaceae bacterium]
MNPRTLTFFLIASLCSFSISTLNAQLNQGFENLTTTLNCGNNNCLYFDSEPASVQHFLSDENIPVSASGTTAVLGFVTEFTPSRSGASGVDGLTDGDVFGVGGPNQLLSELGVEANEGNQAFLMQDTDGQVSMYFDDVDLSGTNSPVLRLDYILSETTWERSSGQNDRFYVRVEIDQCVSATTITLLDTDGGGSGGNNGGDIDALEIEGAWTTLSTDLSDFTGCRARLIIEFDSNSAAEILGIDNVEFTEGRPVGSETIRVPLLVGSTQEAAIVAILEAGLSLGEIDSVPSLEWAAGLVIQQNPEAGSISEPGTAVSLLISTGEQDTIPPEIICPDDIVVSVDGSSCGTRVSFEVLASDGSGEVEVETSVASGSFFALGTTEVTAVATDEAGNTSSCRFNVIIEDDIYKALEIRGFVLVDAHRNQDIMELEEGMTLDLEELTTDSLNIRAIGTEDVESVGFELTGIEEVKRNENLPPYALFGDHGGDYVAHQFLTGSYMLKATPYALNNLSGEAGESLTVSFAIERMSDDSESEIPSESDIDMVLFGEDDVHNSIERVVLVDALNITDIMNIEDGWIIDLLTLAKTRFNIRADTSSDVESVAFDLTGPVHHRRTENVPPFSLFGDWKGNYYSGNLPLGNYRLSITPYTEKNLEGIAGIPKVIGFTIIEGNGGGLFLKLYPNHSNTLIMADFGKDMKQVRKQSLQIHDVQGRLIRSYSSSALLGQNPFEIPTQSIPPGIYFMTVEDTSGRLEQKTFVVRK